MVVARELIGKRLVRRVGRGRISGIIVETEAYRGPGDVASHARHGEASRAAPMFGHPGHAYVYFTYGTHHCLNAVTEPPGSGTAVLIRSLEPAEGIDRMENYRGRTTNLADGPGKLCQALAVDRDLNTADLLGDELWIEDAPPVRRSLIKRTARVGIREGRDHLWRFYLEGNPHVSRHPNY